MIDEQQLNDEIKLMVTLQRDLRLALYDCIHKNVEGDEVPLAPIMGALTWVLAEIMVDIDVQFNKEFLTSFKQTYDAVLTANTAMPDDASVH